RSVFRTLNLKGEGATQSLRLRRIFLLHLPRIHFCSHKRLKYRSRLAEQITHVSEMVKWPLSAAVRAAGKEWHSKPWLRRRLPTADRGSWKARIVPRCDVDADADKQAEQARAVEGGPSRAPFPKVNWVRTAVLGKH